MAHTSQDQVQQHQKHLLAALPAGHFLALPPTFSNDPRTSLTTASHAAPGLAPNVASLAAADFDVDVRTGFLPPGANISRLLPPFDVWEDALDAARGGTNPGEGLRLGGGSEREHAWRAAVASMPVLPTEALDDLPNLRRAHLVLAFLLHFYVHSGDADAANSGDAATQNKNADPHGAGVGGAPATATPTEVPPSISVPLLTISPLVGLPPILTYADTVLWNVHASDPTRPTNMNSNPPTTTLASFTNTKSEAGFYLVSAECEAAGASALALMRQCLDELFLADELALRRLTVYLRQLAVQIDRVGDITLRMMTEVDPEEFYHLIRPWFKGGDADGPTSPGWIFLGADERALAEAENTLDGGDGPGRGRKFSGPSAGQSSLVHAFDIFLTVDHSPRADEVAAGAAAVPPPPAASPVARPVGTADDPHIHLNAAPVRPSSAAPPSGGVVEATFLQRMLQYMPLAHRTFLLHLAAHPTPLRELVTLRAETHPALAAAYDEALAALRRFRDKHMRVVSRFIVQQARRAPSPRVAALLSDAAVRGAEEGAKAVGDADGLRGTGGTPLIRFLKRCRDNTSRAMVGSE